MGWRERLAVGLLALICNASLVSAQVLSPPYFNLAVGRLITASSTCGIREDSGVPERELFCKLTGANRYTDASSYSLIQGQLCDYCDMSDSAKSHPAVMATDGTENWWQSPPLSRGLKYNEVNLTVDLGQVRKMLSFYFVGPKPYFTNKLNSYGN